MRASASQLVRDTSFRHHFRSSKIVPSNGALTIPKHLQLTGTPLNLPHIHSSCTSLPKYTATFISTKLSHPSTRPSPHTIITEHPIMPILKPLALDGSTLEGGGQLVRVAFCLSAITGIPVRVFNIRANRMAKGRAARFAREVGAGNSRSKGMGRDGRRNAGRGRDDGSGGKSDGTGESGTKSSAGAKESHLAAILWLAKECHASIEGAKIGSSDILFVPGDRKVVPSMTTVAEQADDVAARDVINLERPGSVCLILQCLLPYLLLAPCQRSSNDGEHDEQHTTSKLTLRGGTNVSKAMTVDYVTHIFLPMLRRIVGESLPDIQIETIQRGWAGSAAQIGEVKVRVQRSSIGRPWRLDNFSAVERGDIEKISIVIVGDGATIRSDILTGLTNEVAAVLGPDLPVEVEVNEDSGDVRRMYVLLIAHTTNGYRLGSDFLGSGRRPKHAAEQRKLIEEAVKKVVRDLNREIRRGGCVDEHLQDQLVIFQALADGEGKIDGGLWGEQTTEQDIEDDTGEDADDGDESGSLHTRTVRWVCENILNKKALGGKGPGVQFLPGGRCVGVGWNSSGEVVEGYESSPVGQDLERLNVKDTG